MVDRSPNVVIFFTDQQRHDSTGVHGNPLGLTPNFDRLAREQTHVANSFTCQPVCGPARSCLQTGQYATTTGVWKNGFGLAEDATTLAGCFNAAGYHTGYIGKWHLAGEHKDTLIGERGPVPEVARGGYKEWLAVEALEFSVHEYKTVLYDNDNEPVRLPGYRVDAVADAGIQFIDRHQDKPFFLTMSFIEPHHQNNVDDYPPPDGYREMYDGRWIPPDLAALPDAHFEDGDENRRTLGGSTHRHLGGYWGMVKRLDEAFGRVMDALKSLDLDRDTIVLFTSDHACHFKTRNPEYKRSCHESSIRVPTLLAGPGFEAGGSLPQLVSLVDLPPTLLDACGIDVPETMEGRSIMPLVRRQATDWPDDVFVQISESQTGRAVRTKRWKYAVAVPEAGVGGKLPRGERYVETHLYDLQYDPHELRNLVTSKAHAQVREVMRDRLLRRIRDVEQYEPAIDLAEARPSGQNEVTSAETRR
ncbi:MAG: sulfatase-like hydrolase/transferase [Phycisphaeraceae bacterium]